MTVAWFVRPPRVCVCVLPAVAVAVPRYKSTSKQSLLRNASRTSMGSVASRKGKTRHRRLDAMPNRPRGRSTNRRGSNKQRRRGRRGSQASVATRVSVASDVSAPWSLATPTADGYTDEMTRVLTDIELRQKAEDEAFQKQLATLKPSGLWHKGEAAGSDSDESVRRCVAFGDCGCGCGHCGCMSVWLCGCVAVWLCGCVAVCVAVDVVLPRGCTTVSMRDRGGSRVSTTQPHSFDSKRDAPTARRRRRRAPKLQRLPKRPGQHSAGPQGVSRPHGRKFRRVPSSNRPLVGRTQRPSSSMSAPALPDDDDATCVLCG